MYLTLQLQDTPLDDPHEEDNAKREATARPGVTKPELTT